jgi:hypothetical protein
MKITVNFYETNFESGQKETFEYEAKRYNVQDVKDILFLMSNSKALVFKPEHIIVSYEKIFDLRRHNRHVYFQARYSLPDFKVVRKFQTVRNFRKQT